MGFFVYLLVLKTFFLPLFIIPTGSEAETLYGEHALHTCPNCGVTYAVAWQPERNRDPRSYQPFVQCPNCRWREHDRSQRLVNGQFLRPDSELTQPLRPIAGDRIFVHGWPYDPTVRSVLGCGPQRWDIVVFRVPTDGETNYIKRLIGLPGEQIELIDGDLFVDGVITPKTPSAQDALWMRYFDLDHPPLGPSRSANYYPRWEPLDADSTWQAEGEAPERMLRVHGLGAARRAAQFATDPERPYDPGRIEDVYGYNEPYPQNEFVNDVRLSADVELTTVEPDGYVEFCLSREPDWFFARVDSAGLITLEHTQADVAGERERWGEWQSPVNTHTLHLALLHVDGLVAVEVNGTRVPALTTTPEQYSINAEQAREHSYVARTPIVRIAAAGADATLRHVLIERDIYYRSTIGRERGYGVQGRPIQLANNQYYMLGDNSPSSQDSRYAFAPSDAQAIGPHLRERYEHHDFQLGTVPDDQLIGPAFFVYWPGFLPIFPSGPNILPDLGRLRWIE